MSSSSPQQAITRLFHYAKDFRRDVYLASFYSVLNTFFDILPEVLIGVAVDTVVNTTHSFLSNFGLETAFSQLLFLGLLTFIIWTLESLTEYLYSLKWRGLAQQLQHKLRVEAYTHIQNADMSYFENVPTGNLVAILNDDVNQLEQFLNRGIFTIIHVIFSAILVGAIFFVLSPCLAMLAILPIPLILYGSYYFRHLLESKYAAVRTQAGILSSRFANNILGIATIKSYGTEEKEIKTLEKQSQLYQQTNKAAIRVSSAVTPVIRFAILTGFLGTLVYGGWMSLEGQLAIGSYSILVFLTQRLLWPMTRLGEVVDDFYRAMASATRILDLLTVPISIVSTKTSKKKEGAKNVPPQSIQFRGVEFSYFPNEPVLKGITLSIPAGSTVAFVGSTGSGKSTLAKLLLRFYDPTEGSIFLDRHRLNEYSLGELRQLVGYVSQDVFLFDGTIAENIAYGTFEKLTSEAKTAIRDAAKIAGIDDFILSLPKGYDAEVGERGQRLSGGQRQRIAIARAVLRNSPVLILDEATAAVDNETEAAIQKSLEKIFLNRTTIIIAHRLNTVYKANTIYVVKDGEIAEKGTHKELLALKGVYAGLWSLQTGQ